jgi:putative aldouronate transport system permease protein
MYKTRGEGGASPSKQKGLKHVQLSENIQIYSLLLPVLVVIFIFAYMPMYGIVIAFQDYVPGSPFIGDDVSSP